MRNVLYPYLCLFLLPLLFLSCDDDKDNKILYVTIASETRMYNGDYIFRSLWAKVDNDKEWTPFGYIENFEHQEGYEYYLKIWQEKWHNGEVADAPMYRYKLVETIAEKKKDSENIPVQHLFITIASQKVPNNEDTPYYYMNYREGRWDLFPALEGFEYEEGYEYVIQVGRKFNGSDHEPKFSYTYIETMRKEQKESEYLP